MTPKQQAEQMARKCSDMLFRNQFNNNANHQIILTAIPLEELLEVARAANNGFCGHPFDLDDSNCPTCIALANLRNKGIDMTAEQITKAIAKVDGRLEDYLRRRESWNDGEVWDAVQKIHNYDYTTSYDAILPVIQKQSEDVKRFTENWLVLNVSDSSKITLDATPLQLCEALLKALGLWED